MPFDPNSAQPQSPQAIEQFVYQTLRRRRQRQAQAGEGEPEPPPSRDECVCEAVVAAWVDDERRGHDALFEQWMLATKAGPVSGPRVVSAMADLHRQRLTLELSGPVFLDGLSFNFNYTFPDSVNQMDYEGDGTDLGGDGDTLFIIIMGLNTLGDFNTPGTLKMPAGTVHDFPGGTIGNAEDDAVAVKLRPSILWMKYVATGTKLRILLDRASVAGAGLGTTANIIFKTGGVARTTAGHGAGATFTTLGNGRCLVEIPTSAGGGYASDGNWQIDEACFVSALDATPNQVAGDALVAGPMPTGAKVNAFTAPTVVQITFDENANDQFNGEGAVCGVCDRVSSERMNAADDSGGDGTTVLTWPLEPIGNPFPASLFGSLYLYPGAVSSDTFVNSGEVINFPLDDTLIA